MIVVGLTGNLASGKSAATRIFRSLGAQVFDADGAARKATRKGTPIYRAIVKLFGQSFLAKNRQLDRRKLARHVFSHPSDLKKLNILIHPGVIFECVKTARALRHRTGMLVLDVPLLFESRMDKLADYTVVVVASTGKMLARARKKGMSEPLARKVLSAQWPLARKAKLADFVIQNNGSLEDLRAGVKDVYRKIRGTSGRR